MSGCTCFPCFEAGCTISSWSLKGISLTCFCNTWVMEIWYCPNLSLCLQLESDVASNSSLQIKHDMMYVFAVGELVSIQSFPCQMTYCVPCLIITAGALCRRKGVTTSILETLKLQFWVFEIVFSWLPQQEPPSFTLVKNDYSFQNGFCVSSQITQIDFSAVIETKQWTLPALKF